MRPIISFGIARKGIKAGLFATAIVGLAVILPAIGPSGSAGRAAASQMCDSGGIPIWVTIDKVRSSSGTIKVELYSGEAEKSAKKGKKVARTRVKAQRGETNLCLNAPKAGTYSIALYHDENNNKKFDRNFIGIPREGFGFSNNPPFRLGLPDADEVRFRVGQWATRLRISVVYL